MKQGGQSDHTVRHATSNMTQIELSITKVTLALAPESLASIPATSTAFDPCPSGPVSQQCTSAIHVIYAALPSAIPLLLLRSMWPSQTLRVVADELTPSK
jgi:hypothetical protein